MANEIENSSEYYYSRLADTTNPGLVLSQFYSTISGKPASRSTVIMFNRLIKLFGRFNSYFAILDVATMDNVNFENAFPLLAYMCKKRLETTFGNGKVTSENLEPMIKGLEKTVEKLHKHPLVVKELTDE